MKNVKTGCFALEKIVKIPYNNDELRFTLGEVCLEKSRNGIVMDRKKLLIRAIITLGAAMLISVVGVLLAYGEFAPLPFLIMTLVLAAVIAVVQVAFWGIGKTSGTLYSVLGTALTGLLISCVFGIIVYAFIYSRFNFKDMGCESSKALQSVGNIGWRYSSFGRDSLLFTMDLSTESSSLIFSARGFVGKASSDKLKRTLKTPVG